MQKAHLEPASIVHRPSSIVVHRPSGGNPIHGRGSPLLFILYHIYTYEPRINHACPRALDKTITHDRVKGSKFHTLRLTTTPRG